MLRMSNNAYRLVGKGQALTLLNDSTYDSLYIWLRSMLSLLCMTCVASFSQFRVFRSSSYTNITRYIDHTRTCFQTSVFRPRAQILYPTQQILTYGQKRPQRPNTGKDVITVHEIVLLEEEIIYFTRIPEAPNKASSRSAFGRLYERPCGRPNESGKKGRLLSIATWQM